MARGLKPSRRSQASRSAEMRTRLSRAAYEVIAERGHSAFRTAAVAARAGVSEGALLHHFPSKDAVTLAAIEYALTLAADASRRALSRVGLPTDRILKAMLTDFRHFFQGDRFWVALDIAMDASKNKQVSSRLRKIVAECRKPIYGMWQQKLVDCGWDDHNAANAVRMTAAIVSGFAIRTLWTNDAAASRELEERWLAFAGTFA